MNRMPGQTQPSRCHVPHTRGDNFLTDKGVVQFEPYPLLLLRESDVFLGQNNFADSVGNLFFTGAWIETLQPNHTRPWHNVAPFTGAWMATVI